MNNDDLQRESRVTTWPDYYAEQLRNLRAEPIEYGGKTSVSAFDGRHPRVEPRHLEAVAGTLRLGRWCSEHGVDVLPPERTWATRRYCYRCPVGSLLGPPEGMAP